MASIGDLALKVSADVTAFVANLGKAGGAIAGLANKASALSGLANLVKGPGGSGDILGLAKMIPYIGPLVAGVEAIVAPALKMAAAAETTRLQFTALYGDAELATKGLADLKALSLATGYAMSDLVPAARELAAAGLGIDKLAPAMKAIAGVAAATGESVEGLSGALARMISTGHVGGRQLEAFRGPVLTQLAENLGIAQDQLHKFAEEGRIGPRDVAKAIGDVTQQGGKLAGALGDRAKSMQGSWDILGMHVKGVAGEFGKVLAESFSGDAAGGMGGMAKFFDGIKNGVTACKPFIEWLVTNLRDQFSFWATAWEDFGAPVFQAIKEWVESLGVDMSSFRFSSMTAFEAIFKGIGYVADAVGKLGGWFIWITGKLASFSAAAREVIAGMGEGFGKLAGTIVSSITGALAAVMHALGDMFFELAQRAPTDALKKMFGEMHDMAHGAGKAIADAGKGDFTPDWVADLKGKADADRSKAKELEEKGKALMDTPWGTVFGDVFKPWLDKVRGRFAGGAVPSIGPAGKLDLGEGLGGRDKFDEAKLSGAALQGSKEAASVIAKARMDGNGMLAELQKQREQQQKANELAREANRILREIKEGAIRIGVASF